MLEKSKMSKLTSVLFCGFFLCFCKISLAGSRGEKAAKLTNKLKQKEEKQALLSSYVLSPTGFEGLKFLDQVRYLIFAGQMAYELEVIQNASASSPIDKKRKEATRDKSEGNGEMSSVALYDGIKDSSIWQQIFGSWAEATEAPGENSFCSSEFKKGRPCMIAGAQSIFYLETLNGITRQMCQKPPASSRCGSQEVSCNTFGLEAVFSLVDSDRSRAYAFKPLCVKASPRGEVPLSCGKWFSSWSEKQFAKLSIEGSKGQFVRTSSVNLKDSRGLLTQQGEKEFYERYYLLHVFFAANMLCMDERVKFCQAVLKERQPTQPNGNSWVSPNGIHWKYDEQSREYVGTVAGTQGGGTVRSKTKPKGGSFSGKMVDPNSQQAECDQVVGARDRIAQAWKDIPHSIKLWVKQTTQQQTPGRDSRQRSGTAI